MSRMNVPVRAIVDLGAIRGNLLGVRQRVGQRTVLAAVKGNAYGHGAVAVASMIERTGAADWLGVATSGEAMELRRAGVQLPILRLSQALGSELDLALDATVSLTVVDADTIDAAQAASARRGRVSPVHLKLDTGMRRIGAPAERAVDLAKRIVAARNIELEGVFTHLAIADMPAGDAFTDDQLDRFLTAAQAVTDAVGPVPYIHAANSAGVLAHSLEGQTMVRPGIMIYGYYPDAETLRSVPLTQALSLVSSVSFVKQVRAGETVGYGRTWRAASDRWIATVPIGYADGYSRLNSNRGRMLVGGHSFPVAGRVCMDQTMLDLGPDGAGVAVGDEVVAIGRQGRECITTEEVATLMGSITYELTCLITPRVERVYRPA